MCLKKIVVAILMVCSFGMVEYAQALTLEDLEKRIEKLEQENTKLKIKLGETDEKINITADALEAVADKKHVNYLSESVSAWFDKTHIGGYGEMHYNNLDGESGAKDKDEMDFHRFVLFFGHDFNDKISFFSEIELEHSVAGEDQNGEIELEQAYINFKVNDRLNATAGLFLVPVGILNDVHEPPTFYGVERNPVEKNIIPTTWWEGGAGISGEINPSLNYDVYIHSGLETTAGDKYNIRKGRNKVSEARSKDMAATARLKWSGVKGLTLGATYQYQEDISQSEDSQAGGAQLYEIHAVLNHGLFTLKTLYALWDLNGSGPRAVGADRQVGYYIEPSFKITPQFGVFARFNEWDNQEGNNSKSGKQQWDAGVNYWPHPDVVIKADYQYQDNDNRMEQNGFNLGIGYQF